MVELATTIIGIALGGTVTWIIQHAIQRSSQRRQLYLDIAKHKFESIQQSSADYVSMTSALSRFSELSSKGDESNEEKFYAMCKYFHGYWGITGFELDTLEGEDVISTLTSDILNIFEQLGDNTVSNMIDLVETKKEAERIRFPEFRKKIPKPLFGDFCNKIINEPSTNKKLTDYCVWLRQIILFEINTAYSMWYGEKPKFDLTDKLKNYLQQNNYKVYIQRLEVTKKSKIHREFFKLQRWISN